MTMELVRAPREWFKDAREVHVLLAWLVDTTRITTLAEAVSFTEKPWNWGTERELMLREEEEERWLAEQDERRSRYSL